MYLIFRYPAGSRVEAMLLSATRDRMKVVVRGQEDTLEFSLIGDQWISECGSPLEIESLMIHDPGAAAAIWSDAQQPLVAGAVS